MDSEEQVWAERHGGWTVVETEPECVVKWLWHTQERCPTTTGYCCGSREQLRVWQHPVFLRQTQQRRQLLLQIRLPELGALRTLTSWCEEFSLWFELYPAPALVKGTTPFMIWANHERRGVPFMEFDEWLLRRRFDRDSEGVGRLAELVASDRSWPFHAEEEEQVTRLHELLKHDDVVTLNSYAHARRRYALSARRYPGS